MFRLLTFSLLVIFASARKYGYQQGIPQISGNQGWGGQQGNQGWGGQQENQVWGGQQGNQGWQGQQGNHGWQGQQDRPFRPQQGSGQNRPSYNGHGYNSFESHERGSFERPGFGSHGSFERPDFGSHSSHEFPFPGGHGFPGGQGFPGGHGFPGSGPQGGHHFFPIFKNITREARRELKKILVNRTLTKAEMETELKAWATEQGADVEKQLADMLEKKQKMKEDVKAKINEVLEEVKTGIAKVEEIKNNMDITKAEEKQQIFELFRNMTRSIPKIIGLVTKTAMKELKRNPALPTVVPSVGPSVIPTIQP